MVPETHRWVCRVQVLGVSREAQICHRRRQCDRDVHTEDPLSLAHLIPVYLKGGEGTGKGRIRPTLPPSRSRVGEVTRPTDPVTVRGKRSSGGGSGGDRLTGCWMSNLLMKIARVVTEDRRPPSCMKMAFPESQINLSVSILDTLMFIQSRLTYQD